MNLDEAVKKLSEQNGLMSALLTYMPAMVF